VLEINIDAPGVALEPIGSNRRSGESSRHHATPIAEARILGQTLS
jgi:hypothetical protein